MNSNKESLEIKELADYWQQLLASNQLNVCVGKLEGVSAIEVRILRLVNENPDIILKEISQKLNIITSTLTSAINRLERRKLLKRTISKRDLRSFQLKLTKEGKMAIEEYLEAEQKVWKLILKPLSQDERDQFIRIFKKITDNIIEA